MQSREITIPTSGDGFVKSYIRAINGLLNLTDKELLVLDEMIRLDREVTATKRQRKILVKNLEMSSVMALNNVIKSLKDKKILIPAEDGYKYNPLVIPTSDRIVLKFKVTDATGPQ